MTLGFATPKNLDGIDFFLAALGDFFSESPEAKATWKLYDLSTDPAEAKE